MYGKRLRALKWLRLIFFFFLIKLQILVGKCVYYGKDVIIVILQK